MTIKSFERPHIELAQNLAFKKARLIDNEYKLSIAELNAEQKLEFVSKFLEMNQHLDKYIQEYLDEACEDRMYAESQTFGEWYDEQ